MRLDRLTERAALRRDLNSLEKRAGRNLRKQGQSKAVQRKEWDGRHLTAVSATFQEVERVNPHSLYRDKVAGNEQKLQQGKF